jgi:hypothetical protein
VRASLPMLLGCSLALSAAGCSDYLSAPDVTSDPTKPTELTRPGPLYVGVQEAGPPLREGFGIAQVAVQYTQQIAGVAAGADGVDRYQVKPSDMDQLFGLTYGSGGLLDIHKMEQLARAVHDSLYLGIGKIYEALVIGYAADVWGDIPYRQAADSNIAHPVFDPQLQVYQDLQMQLDSAIGLFLIATGPTNAGGAADGNELIYRGRDAAELRRVYAAVAHSLKARYYMHVAPTNPSQYQKAFEEAQLGIGTPADDFLWFHNATQLGQYEWWQINSTGYTGFAPGAAMIQLLLRRIGAGIEDSSRLQFYFTPVADGGYFGYRPTGNKLLPNGGGSPAGNYSGFGPFMDGISDPPDFRQPELTYAEMQLIMAEAQWHISCPGCGASTVVAQAQPFLDAARKNRRYGALGGAPVSFPDLGSVPASLQNIMEEKYVTLFLNPEVWNDYKRTCLPSLAPAPPSIKSTTPATAPIPGRLPYSQQERNTNPNTPADPSTDRNTNQPQACPVLNYTSSSPLAN